MGSTACVLCAGERPRAVVDRARRCARLSPIVGRVSSTRGGRNTGARDTPALHNSPRAWARSGALEADASQDRQVIDPAAPAIASEDPASLSGITHGARHQPSGC